MMKPFLIATQMEDMLRNLPSGVVVFDAAGQMTQINPAFDDPEPELSRIKILIQQDSPDLAELRLRGGRILLRHDVPFVREGEIQGALWQVQDVTALKAQQNQREFLSERDPLTGLLNRRGFDHRLQMLEQRPLGRLTDMPARIGGDELAILMPECHTEELAEQIADRINLTSGIKAAAAESWAAVLGHVWQLHFRRVQHRPDRHWRNGRLRASLWRRARHPAAPTASACAWAMAAPCSSSSTSFSTPIRPRATPWCGSRRQMRAACAVLFRRADHQGRRDRQCDSYPTVQIYPSTLSMRHEQDPRFSS